MRYIRARLEMMVISSVSHQEQWKADSLGQAADQATGERQQGADLLPDGEDAGHLGRVPDYQTLPFSGEKHQPGKQWVPLESVGKSRGSSNNGSHQVPQRLVAGITGGTYWRELGCPFIAVWPHLCKTAVTGPCFGLRGVITPEASEHREPGREPVTGSVVSPCVCLLPEHPPALVTRLRQRSYF